MEDHPTAGPTMENNFGDCINGTTDTVCSVVAAPDEHPFDEATAQTILVRRTPSFADLPLEILTMIVGHLVDEYLETRYEIPNPFYEQMEFDFRTRERSFFNARRVNQNMRRASLDAFFQRTAPGFRGTSTAAKNHRLYLEEKFSWDIDKAQARIWIEEEEIAVRVAEEAKNSSLQRSERLRFFARRRNEILAAQRVSAGLRDVSWEYLKITRYDEDHEVVMTILEEISVARLV